MTQITKEDLKETENNILNGIAPVTKDIKEIKLTLYGRESREGLVGDVNNLKNSAKWVKWLAGGGFLTGLTGWVKEYFK